MTMEELLMRGFAARLCLLAILIAATSPAGAETLPAPAGEVILTVDGAIANTTDGKEARFDVAALEALGLTTVKTSTPWTDGAVTYEGVLGRVLMEHVGVKGDKLVARALNDYLADIPISDFSDYDVILAVKANGAYLPIRDKGPIFVVYPLDAHPDLRNNTIYSRCVWQLTRLTLQ
jgi:hypothetical protein